MSEKEEIRRKLEEVDELRARIKELESNPVNWWWSPQNQREVRRLIPIGLVWGLLIIPLSMFISEVTRMSYFVALLGLVSLTVVIAVIYDRASRRQ